MSATFEAVGEKESIKYIHMPQKLRGQYQYFTEAKMDKLHGALEDFSFHSLEEGVHDYIKII